MNSKKEKLLQEAYNTFIDLMLYDFPIDRIHEIVDEKVTGYGTTKDERILDIAGLRKLVDDQRTQGVGIEFKYDIKPVGRQIMADENAAQYVDEVTVIMIIDGNTNKIPLRLSTLLEFKETTWKVVHIHGSLAVESEDDTWHLNEWQQKNAELQKLVDEKTAELTQQNRELQIEAALERVRARAMAMHKSEELAATTAVLFQQFHELDPNSERMNIGIVKEEENIIEFWSTEQGGKRIDQLFKADINEPSTISKLFAGWKAGKDTLIIEQSGQELKDWLKYLKEGIGMPFNDELLHDKRYQYVSYFSSGMILTSSQQPLLPDSLKLMLRFAKVFEQTYTRFLDLQKAEAQARESQIQLALERVRARTMAMHESFELKEVIQAVYDQFIHLNIHIEHTGFILDYKSRDDMHIWLADQHEVPSEIIIPYFDSPHWNSFIEAKEKGKDFFVNHLSFEEKNKFYKDLFQLIPGVAKKTSEFYFSSPGLAISTVMLEDVGLYIENFSGIPYSDKENDTLMRFGKVFQQTYTRFLDLQKAEAQAREAQIEAALERVRSTSLAMHSSQDLSKVVYVVFTELVKLDAQLDRCLILTVNPETSGITWYLTGKEGLLSNNGFLVENNPHPSHQAYLEGWRTKRKKWHYLLAGEEKKSCDAYLFSQTQLARLPDFIKTDMAAVESIHLTISSDDFGCVIASSLSTLSDAHAGIVDRFTSVFNQTYTRFLDLQKAEAQAREAKIEAALERVRARAMAMQNSSELAELVAILFKELTRLDFSLTRCYIYIIDPESFALRAWTSNTETPDLPESYYIEYLDLPYYKALIKAWKERNPKFVYELGGEEKKETDRVLFTETEYSRLPESVKSGMMSVDRVFLSYSFNNFGGLQTGGLEPLSDENLDIFSRFGKVFDLTYTRFNDLKQAEARAREAQIEAALERVRAQAMAMHNSDDMGRCIIKMFSELTAFGVDEGTRFGIGILNHDNENNQLWTARKDGEEIKMHIGNLDMTLHPLLKSARKAWKEQTPLHKYVLEGEDLLNYYKMINEAPDYKLQVAIEKLPEREIHYGFIFNHGFFYAFCPREFQPELIDITQRFSSLFSQTYTRFLDLQKAEAQAREAQIEAALERVRAASMAMHKSEELKKVASAVFRQLKELTIEMNSASILLLSEHNADLNIWIGMESDKDYSTKSIHVPEIGGDYNEAIKSRMSIFTKSYNYEEKNKLWNYLFEHSDFKTIPDERKKFILDAEFYTVSVALLKNTGIQLIRYSNTPFSEKENDILQRFSKVFEQAYTRFLDLQKSEAQAREAQIEVALERVRAQAMAMHHTEDLGKTIRVYYDQLDFLFDTSIVRCGAGLLNKENKIAEMSTASRDPEGETYSVKGAIDMQGHPLLDSTYSHWLAQQEHYYVLRGNEIREYYQYITNQVAIPENKGEAELHFYFPMFDEGSFYVVTNNELPENELQIFRRFSSVLSLTYRRFNDLQKAETQVREAQIEAALERVRSKTMAMHDSQDVGETVAVMFDELTKLGIEKTIRCGIIIIDETKHMEVWNASSDPAGKIVLVIGRLDMNLHPALQGVYHAWKSKQATYSYEFIGQDLKDYFHAITNYPDYPLQVDINKLPSKYYNNEFYFAEGAIFAFTLDPIPPEMSKIIKRFAGVFGQTYRRYLDLQKAEAQARESIKQASLDRIRGEIASMRTTSDLDRITPLIWSELTIQGIPFIRCGVFIMDEEKKIIHNYLSLPDGKAIAAFQLPYATPGAVSNILQNWQERKIFLDHWDDVAMKEFADILVSQRILHSPDQYLSTLPKGGFYLHFLPFNQGMLYVGNTMQLNEDEVNLIQSLANTFSTAYARYEDFNKLEIAKKQVDDALVHLKQAQQQLVQAEKMASLGELTAGIAHEIQNPLNFVNNFSEVSEELLVELNEELIKGDLEEAKMISADVIQNLQKIHHHGKRASSIVKGMLEHSRTGSKEKQLTDINALADEYLRLSYHGLRAKDKSFNAEFIADLDPSIPKINVLSQDIGRVLLNLINNAFYAVSEKSKKGIHGYKPKVIVKTKKRDKLLEICVVDNADGIPTNIINKIFQPFFTTKPTGSGTGLGLSLSYDIITMGHNGTLEVDSTEGLGTEFIIQLPMV